MDAYVKIKALIDFAYSSGTFSDYVFHLYKWYGVLANAPFHTKRIYKKYEPLLNL